MKKNHAKILAVCALIVALAISSVWIAVFHVRDWLKGHDVPMVAEAAIVLSGPPTRSLYAADLYKAGYVRDIYITRPIREGFAKILDDMGVYFPRTEQMNTDVLVKKGVPSEHIHIVGNAVVSTADEADLAKEIFKGETCAILVVSSPYHVKRSQLIFGDVMKNCQIRVLATPYEEFPKKWWTDQNSAEQVILESTKIIFYKLGGRFGKSRKMKGHG
ncbi:MAG: YdcF family protein [Syntrophorhabdaceae bacterium]